MLGFQHTSSHVNVLNAVFRNTSDSKQKISGTTLQTGQAILFRSIQFIAMNNTSQSFEHLVSIQHCFTKDRVVFASKLQTNAF